MTRLSILAAALAMAVSPLVAQTPTEAEDQTPTGKFLNATEVRPILAATQGSWIAVREFDGKDLLYFTHLMSWRCGLYAVSYSVNGAQMQPFEMPECDPANAMSVPQDATIYLEFPLGSIKTIEIELLYDDLGLERASFERQNVMTP